MDNHGLASTAVAQKSECKSFMQDDAGEAAPPKVELMLAPRRGIAGIGDGGGGGGGGGLGGGGDGDGGGGIGGGGNDEGGGDGDGGRCGGEGGGGGGVDGGDGGDGGGYRTRGWQSEQSVPKEQYDPCAPGPPS